MPKVNQDSVIGTVTRIVVNGEPRKCGSISSRGRRLFFFSKADWLWGSSSLLCWWVLEPLSKGVKQLKHEVNHSLPSNAKVKNESSDISIHTNTNMRKYVFMPCARKELKY
jgi:hypothetical protein